MGKPGEKGGEESTWEMKGEVEGGKGLKRNLKGKKKKNQVPDMTPGGG